jgi:phosphatidylinositol 4-kinase
MAAAVEAELLILWRERHVADAVSAAADRLIELAQRPGALSEIEFLLPQFAHMLIHISNDVPEVEELEKFVLTVCQMSTHIALQFFWFVYAALEENTPKRTGHVGAATYARCANLLLHLEQCVVYGAGAVPKRSGSVDLIMERCVEVAVQSSISRDGLASKNGGVTMIGGYLHKRGGGTTTKWSRRGWTRRWVEVRDRMLLYYPTERDAKFARPRGSMLLSTAELLPTNWNPNSHLHGPHGGKLKYYIAVRCRQSGLIMEFCAGDAATFSRWVTMLNIAIAMPMPPGLNSTDLHLDQLSLQLQPTRDSGSEVSENRNGPDSIRRTVSLKYSDAYSNPPTPGAPPRTTASAEMLHAPSEEEESNLPGTAGLPAHEVQERIYMYFSSQRDFLRSLTDLAERLRFLRVEERQGALQPGLDALSVPEKAYFPLSSSAEPLRKIIAFPDQESIVFNTKARCPLLLVIEVQQQDYTVSDCCAVRELPVGEVTGGGESALAPDRAPAEAAAATETLTVSQKKKELWDAKEYRLRACSPRSSLPGWGLASLIIKSNDDVRQEVFIMQLIRYMQSIFPADLTWLRPYHIQATGPDTGLIETITSAEDLDRLKKHPGYTSLRDLFIERYGPPESDGFKQAQDKFAKSLAGYSIVMWLLLLRDRHNGNLMIDSEGHFFHIDFGFCLGHSTGKQIGGMIESAPWKLTAEYVTLLDGVGSEVYQRYCKGCTEAMVAAHQHADVMLTMVEIAGTRSMFPCFHQTPLAKVVSRMRKRLYVGKTDEQVRAEFPKVIEHAREHKGTYYYDYFQKKQQGYAM